MRGNSTFDLKSGAEVELKNGTLRLETDVESDGKFLCAAEKFDFLEMVAPVGLEETVWKLSMMQKWK